ncbi:MAG TPA: hypothetical protein VM143_04095 [Acidimicrobiales bacterium]|nr:hypothetical protein [Acidimicrobiales bacterium]
MRPVVSLRCSAVVVVLLVVFGASVWVLRPEAAPAPGPAMAEVVARTRAAGSARLMGRFEPSSGPPVVLSGRLSFVDGACEVIATMAAAEGGASASVVRVVGDGRAWVRPAGSGSWTAVDGGAVSWAAGARGWADLLSRAAGGEPSADGVPSRVWVDRAGRIARLRTGRPRGPMLDLRFVDFGTEVDVVAP